MAAFIACKQPSEDPEEDNESEEDDYQGEEEK